MTEYNNTDRDFESLKNEFQGLYRAFLKENIDREVIKQQSSLRVNSVENIFSNLEDFSENMTESDIFFKKFNLQDISQEINFLKDCIFLHLNKLGDVSKVDYRDIESLSSPYE